METPLPVETQPALPAVMEHPLVYDGRAGPIFRIWLVNLLLSIITLGIYSFWGKTRIRHYIIGSFALQGDRFEYTGTGKELFLGFLTAFPILLLLYLPSVIWEPEQHPLVNLMFIPFVYLIFVAIYAALRYRFSRTTWRGVRGRLTGSAFAYGGRRLLWSVINLITLGITIPVADIALYRYIITHSHFGSAGAVYDGKAAPLMNIHLLTLILMLPSFTISRFWYKAALIRHQYNHTTIDNLRLCATHSGGGLCTLTLTNMLLYICTLGLAKALIIQRTMRYYGEHIFVLSDINTAHIRQSEEELGRLGEGLDGAFGLDTGFI